MGLLSFLPIVGGLIDKIFGDKRSRDDAKARIRELELRGQLEPLLRQIEVNIEEAKSGSFFIAGWRPMAAWMCIAAMGLGFVTTVFIPSIFALIPLFGKVDISAYQAVVQSLRAIDIGVYISMLMGLLGLGTMRAYEKSHGIDSWYNRKENKIITADKFLRLYTKRFSRVTPAHKEIIYELFSQLDKDTSEAS